jgi:gliding motility-associated protein GldC
MKGDLFTQGPRMESRVKIIMILPLFVPNKITTMNSEIKFNIRLDEDKIPETITWSASDSGIEGVKPCRATMLTIWDPKENTTLRIDLWTKEMLIDDMKRFFYESFMSMADTYQRATNDLEASNEIKKFAEAFGKKVLTSS